MQKTKKAGFTLVEIMIVVAIIGLLAAIAVPSFVKARETSQKNTCINNLRQMDGAKDQWAIENNKSTGDAINADVYLFLKSGVIPECPANGAYTPGVIGTTPLCSLNALGHEL